MSKPVNIAVIADFMADDFVSAFEARLGAAGTDVALHHASVDQVLPHLLSDEPWPAGLTPDLTLLLIDDELLLSRAEELGDPEGLCTGLRRRMTFFTDALREFARRTTGHVAVHTIPLPIHRLKTVISLRERSRLGAVWRGLNIELLGLAQDMDNVSVLDLETMLSTASVKYRDERLYRYARMSWSSAVSELYADECAALVRAIRGRSRKCLVVDLDNTLWGGEAGERGVDGLEIGPLYPGNAFADFQGAVKALREQGVLLAISSKNDADVALKAFEENPEFVLRGEDFIASAIDWNPKHVNIAAMADEIGIGVDGMVFADDSPFECELVERGLPGIEVVRLAGDPAHHTATLLQHGFFDQLRATDTDRTRTEMYAARRDRTRARGTAVSTERFLAGLELRVELVTDPSILPRAGQLARRTNQFNLTGSHETPAGCAPLGYRASDRFGDDGLVGVVWIERGARRWAIRNWVMSCRVFARGIEFAVLHRIAAAARERGAELLTAEYRPTARNAPAGEFLRKSGFSGVTDDPAATGRRTCSLPLPPPAGTEPAWILVEGDQI
jgi:FkbH-like protein